MTIEQMKEINVGDVIQDLELLKNTSKIKYCVITKKDIHGVNAIAFKKEDEGHYPHSFNFNEYDCIKLGSIKFNIFDYMWQNQIKSIESLNRLGIKL